MPEISPIGRGPVGRVDHSSSPSTTSRRHGDDSRAGNDRADRVELSDHARFVEQLRQIPAARTERVESLKQAIANGTYPVNDRLDVALDRLLDELA